VVPDRVEDNVFSVFDRVLKDQEQPARTVGPDPTLGDRPEHVVGLYRCADSETLDEFIQAFVDGVVADAKWARIEPHDCTHDRDKSGPCKVYDGNELPDKIVEQGGVPDAFQ